MADSDLSWYHTSILIGFIAVVFAAVVFAVDVIYKPSLYNLKHFIGFSVWALAFPFVLRSESRKIWQALKF